MSFKTELVTHIPFLRRFARALTGDQALADDLVQDCIERALRKHELYDPERPMRAWLYTILRNLHVSGRRSELRRGSNIGLEEIPRGADAVPPRQEDRLALGDIEEAVRRLPLVQREVLLLVVLEDMSYRDVAEITGVPIGTVMSRLSRARSFLRQEFDGDKEPRLRRVK
ncbi:MAG TPA: RNA polymerase sigma factor [Aestuariivirgaceae bacterium]|jgi:RNA polymerase sigma-70 factor, ECF subfamily|nr:RNA polymerase sigma factor [Aestuariivirgaceae bacterium]